MSKLLLSILIGSVFFSACSKERSDVAGEPVAPCELQTANPAGRSYTTASIVDYNCTDRHCGILPLSSKNYWIYEDSIFSGGTLLRVQIDTLRYTTMVKSMTDDLVWWESNMDIGLPATLYANDSAFFSMGNRLFTPDVKDAKKDYAIPAGDSIRYMASFDDVAAFGRTVRMIDAIKTPAGSFNGYILFEKEARFVRRDRLYFKPGIGVLKYTREKSYGGSPQLKMQQVSTLIGYYLE